jgi:signal transduction histidine kinase
MINLSHWLEQHDDSLIRAASLALTTDEELRQTVEISIVAFFQGVQWWVDKKDFGVLRNVLTEWVSSRSLVTGGESGSLLLIIQSIRRVTWGLLRETLSPDEALDSIVRLSGLFDDAVQEVARLESDQIIAQAKRDVAAAEAVVKRVDKSKSDFIAVAAHELKTPLTLIEGYLSMLKSTMQSNPELAPYLMMLNGMQGGASRLREIVEDMIDVSLIDNKILNLHMQPVWINRLVDIIGFDMQTTLQSRNLKLEIHKEEITERPTYADSERLYQAVQKVLSNAVKYTPDGGAITITARDLPGFCDLQVSDTGIGIAPENLARIFEKFSSQAEVSTHSSGKSKFKGGGPGLGLAIAKGIMEAHGGSIWAESGGYDEKALPGSTFHIMIPMRAAPSDNPLSELYKDGKSTVGN